MRAEIDRLSAEYADLERRHRAAVISGDVSAAEGSPGGPPAETDRLELRSRASLGRYLLSALRGQSLTGAEAELAAETGVDGIPLELWDTADRDPSRRDPSRRSNYGTPSTTGMNLDPLRPLIYARAVAPRLGVAMPRVESGTFATATITTGLTAGAMAAGAARESSAAVFTAQTTTPHRISCPNVDPPGGHRHDRRRQLRERFLRQNVAVALTDQLDNYALNGDGQSANPTGLLSRLTDPTDPTDIVNWAAFIAAAAGGIDGGPWAETMGSITLLVNPATMRLAETTFQSGSGTDTPGELSAAAYLRQHASAFFANRRMPEHGHDHRRGDPLPRRDGGPRRRQRHADSGVPGLGGGRDRRHLQLTAHPAASATSRCTT